MTKVIFILQRKSGTSREQCLDAWAGEQHTAIVRKLPGLTRWVQHHVVWAPAEAAACDGVGELSFEGEEPMQTALNSPEMAAAVEDAQTLLDMEKTGMVIAEEKIAANQMSSRNAWPRPPAQRSDAADPEMSGGPATTQPAPFRGEGGGFPLRGDGALSPGEMRRLRWTRPWRLV